jgi:hypothetical protein
VTDSELKALLVHPDKQARTEARHELQRRALADPTIDGYELAIERNGERIVLLRPWPEQVPAMDLSTKTLFVRGPRNSGKTAIWLAIAHFLALRFPEFRYLVVRRSLTELEKQVLNKMPEQMKRLTGDASNYNKTTHTCVYPNGSLGVFGGADSEDDVKKVVGSEYHLLIVDEAPEIDFELLVMLRGSVRCPEDYPFRPITRLLGNPFGPSCEELYDWCVDKTVDRDKYPDYDEADHGSVFLPIEANLSVDAVEYWKQFVGLSDQKLQAWKHGKRVDAGALFELVHVVTVPLPDVGTGTMVETRQPYHVLDKIPTFQGTPVDRLDFVRIACGYDHGFSDSDPAVMLWGALVGPRVIIFHEQTWRKTVIKDICKDIVEFRGDRQVITYCDPSLNIDQGTGFTLIDHFAVHQVMLEPARNDRELFVTIVQEALNTEVSPGMPRVQIVRQCCPELMRTLPKQRGNPNNPRKLADSKTDHWTISLGYLLMGLGLTTTEQPRQKETDYNDLSQFRPYRPH